ncbi:VWA domain-containing protein [Candidatus Babela massiliensis]|uniref:von Willebrand factor type A (VWA) domain containing protein n=1 Tax=Candidatus Babela massiliensis TaxID=673862 RepID=V6DHP7_9BACT|nr:VWA domain-containing protein [Candidatus Babela massiliensis]CDK31075.1 von Willebrand factor type A (vWA) domain containing protein [Candidatus Babela massiliensis]
MINILWSETNNLKLVLPLFIFGTILISKQMIWIKNIANILAGSKYIRKFLINFSLSKRIIKSILLGLSILMISGALLRPQWSEAKDIIKQEGRDLLVALDISRSMLAQDCKPNRLEFAKNKIKNLINKLDSERIGLIVFSGEAFFQCPLTNDICAIYNFIDTIDTETISTGTTALDAPIRKAIELFSNIEGKKNKLLLIFTDGEDFSQNLSDLKLKSQEVGLKIFTIGIGTQTGAPIPIFNNGKIKDYQRDKQNQIVISKLEENVLQDLSKETGAQYIKSTDNNKDIDLIVQKIAKFEKEKFEDKSITSLQEKYHYFALGGFICLLLEWLI